MRYCVKNVQHGAKNVRQGGNTLHIVAKRANNFGNLFQTYKITAQACFETITRKKT